jgi:lipoate-protein ligase A
MAIDEAILWSCQKGYVPPTLRFYGWKQPTLSIGYFQKVFEAFDVTACHEPTYPIVRRITGGRAVLHDQEVTYSIVLPKGDLLFSTSVLQAYRNLGMGLVAGCKILGIDAQMVLQPREKFPRSQRSPACFSSPSWYEILVGGKKLIGSAQKRLDTVLLQQGSILMSYNPKLLTPILRSQSELSVAALSDRVTSIKDLLTDEISSQEVISAMVRGFEQGCGITVQEASLTALEWEIAHHFYETKYSQYVWNYQI